MIMHFAYVGASLIALALLASWMFIVSRRHVVTRVFGCTIAVVLALVAWINVTAMLGYAVSAPPEGKVQIVSFIDDAPHGQIYLWVRATDGPRAYVVPYSEGLASGLMNGMKQAREQGGRMMLEMQNGDGAAGGGQGAVIHGAKGSHQSSDGHGVSGLGGAHGGQQFHIVIEAALPPKS